MKKILVLLIALVAMTASTLTAQTPAQRQEAVTVFNVSPAMKGQNCENKIRTAIRFVPGVNDVTADLQAQTVTVKYDPAKTSAQALKAEFEKVGFQAVCPECKEGQPAKATTPCGRACGGCHRH